MGRETEGRQRGERERRERVIYIWREREGERRGGERQAGSGRSGGTAKSLRQDQVDP